MSLEDLEILKDDLITSFDDFWNYDILKSELLSDNSKYIIAKLNDDIVGFAGLKLILDEAEIMNIVVKNLFVVMELLLYFYKNFLIFVMTLIFLSLIWK